MTIYLVLVMDYSGYPDILKIYSTKDKAEEFLRKVKSGEEEVECMMINIIERRIDD